MVLWGGYSGTLESSGGRYDPTTDTWKQISLAGAPAGRLAHSAVWTGSQMVVWGGQGFFYYLNSGGRYDPATDTWLPTSLAAAPTPRSAHMAVWTGSRMVVWGGLDGTSLPLDSGGLYDPATDTWAPTALAGAPTGRQRHTAVWTGNEMIIWGGSDGTLPVNSGGRYDPASDTWLATTLGAAPAERSRHTAVWTGNKMIVWGGEAGGSALLNSGGLYDPATDTWISSSTAGAPIARSSHTAVWTGSHMVVWGGASPTVINSGVDSGGRYEPATDTWTPTSADDGAPTYRYSHTAVWTGSQMIVWGGRPIRGNFMLNSGGRYDPATDAWTPTAIAGAPIARSSHTAVWTGSQMIVWGGTTFSTFENSGGRYDPATDTWSPTALAGAPARRVYHTAIWTGTEMIVWGGYDGAYPTQWLDSGGRYDPATDIWTPTALAGAPTRRQSHTAVWTGSRMVVWGGYDGQLPYTRVDSGGRYDAATDTWSPTSLVGAPARRYLHTAIWSGSQMIVWGGDTGLLESSGGRYNPTTDTWTPTSLAGAPTYRYDHTAVWTGSEMVVWGGGVVSVADENSGGRYDPAVDAWTPTSLVSAPSARDDHTAVWTGTQMIVWGGYSVNRGGRYNIVAACGPPIAVAASALFAECSSPAGATVVLDGSGSSDPDSTLGTHDDIVLFEWLEDLGHSSQTLLGTGESVSVTLPLGPHAITLRVTDSVGQTAVDPLLVTVQDTTPPEFVVDLSPDLLWPANHRLIEVTASFVVADACSTPAVLLVSVASNEPDDGDGDGGTVGDIQGALLGTEDNRFELRAERRSDGDGRIYTVAYTATDGAGNVSPATQYVLVPHDQGGAVEPILIEVGHSTAGTVISWSAAAGARFYNVIRGGLTNLVHGASFISLGPVVCIDAASLDTSTEGQEDPENPAPGRVHFYLVEYDDGSASSYGSEGAGVPEVPGSGACGP
jgi:N-acetylneuraminic acid mutarotase